MKCPVCTATDLVMSERSGIEIDYCPQCRGVWLDRGELDKIIARSVPSGVAEHVPQQGTAYQQDSRHWGKSDHHHEQRTHDNHDHPYHGRKSFWKELFD